MQRKILWIGLVFFLAISLQVNAQESEQHRTFKRWFVGSTLYLIGDFDKSPDN